MKIAQDLHLPPKVNIFLESDLMWAVQVNDFQIDKRLTISSKPTGVKVI